MKKTIAVLALVSSISFAFGAGKFIRYNNTILLQYYLVITTVDKTCLNKKIASSFLEVY